MNLNLLSSFLGVVERALQVPGDKAAVKIAIDGLAAWKAIADNPRVQQLEADIAAYVALLPAPQVAPAALEPPAREVQNGVRGGPNGGRMSFDQ